MSAEALVFPLTNRVNEHFRETQNIGSCRYGSIWPNIGPECVRSERMNLTARTGIATPAI